MLKKKKISGRMEKKEDRFDEIRDQVACKVFSFMTISERLTLAKASNWHKRCVQKSFQNQSVCLFRERHKVTDHDLNIFRHAISIDLRWCSHLTDIGLSYLTKLKHINVSYNQHITDVGLRYLTHVESLEIVGCPKVRGRVFGQLTCMFTNLSFNNMDPNVRKQFPDGATVINRNTYSTIPVKA